MAGMLQGVCVRVVGTELPEVYCHVDGILGGGIGPVRDKPLTQGSGEEGVLDAKVVFPSTAKDDYVLGNVNQPLGECGDVGKRAH